MRLLRFGLSMALVVAAAGMATARIIQPLRSIVVASPDGGALLRIDPAPWRQRDPEQRAQASVYRYDAEAKSYRLSSTFALRNPVAPDQAAISDDGAYIATCDDWDHIGCTPSAIVVYRGSGEFIKAWSLEDIFSADEIRRLGPFPNNTPSREWRGSPIGFIAERDGPVLSIPWRMDAAWHVGFRLEMKSLTLTRVPGLWLDAKPQH